MESTLPLDRCCPNNKLFTNISSLSSAPCHIRQVTLWLSPLVVPSSIDAQPTHGTMKVLQPKASSCLHQTSLRVVKLTRHQWPEWDRSFCCQSWWRLEFIIHTTDEWLKALIGWTHNQNLIRTILVGFKWLLDMDRQRAHGRHIYDYWNHSMCIWVKIPVLHFNPLVMYSTAGTLQQE